MLLWRCSLCCCDAATRVVATRRCNSVVFSFFSFFFLKLNDYWQVQESSTSLPTCEKERNIKQDKALKPVFRPNLALFGGNGVRRRLPLANSLQ
jgi:hypothetical protein